MIVSDPMSLIITEMNMFDKTNLKLLKLKEKLISCWKLIFVKVALIVLKVDIC